ncbi:MAG: hypothetical protein DRO23_05365 [Thermoprotei archaeon]|nr:MAG: hypothetical protein DRO23_05365 [Thermoprotei archaeon]
MSIIEHSVNIEHERLAKVLPVILIVIYSSTLLFGISVASTNPTYAHEILSPIVQDIEESLLTKLCHEASSLWFNEKILEALLLMVIIGFLRLASEAITALIPPYVAFTYFIEGLFIGTSEYVERILVTMYIPITVGDLLSISLIEGGLFQLVLSKVKNKPLGNFSIMLIITGFIGLIVTSYLATFSSCVIERIVLSYKPGF